MAVTNEIHFSKLNPIHLRLVNPNRLDKYFSKPYEDYRFHETQQPWESQTIYKQKFTWKDSTNLQFISNFSSQKIRIVDCSDNVVKLEYIPTQGRQVKSRPTFYVYETTVAWGLLLANKTYFVQVWLGGILYCISEPIYLTEFGPGTILFNSTHPHYHGGILFETGYVPEFRVEGYIGRLEAGAFNNLFTDFNQNNITLSSVPYVTYGLIIGTPQGIPDWIVEKLNWIWSCRNVYIDGIQYTRDAQDGVFEYFESEQHPMRGVKIKIREGINENAMQVNPTLSPDLFVTVAHNIQTDVFGEIPSESSGIITVYDTNF